MMIAFFATLIAVILVSNFGFSALAENTHQTFHLEKQVSDILRSRERRANQIGKAAIRQLLGSTRRIFSDGLNEVFVKTGNLEDAIRDFNKLQLSDVISNLMDGNIPTRLTGRIKEEKLRVVVMKRGNSVTLDITNIVTPTETYTVPVVHKIIVYTD